jgi:glycosyltransferase involved in cell wall biosynthesis
MRDVSVVLPLHRNADSVAELCGRLSDVLRSRGASYEIILVDDACPEGSGAVARELANRNSNIIAIHNDVNLGQQRSVLRGLARASGRVVVIMDADLQDRPEEIPLLLEEFSKGSWGAVFAAARRRHNSRSRLFTSLVFKSLMRWICGIPAGSGLFVALTQESARRILSIQLDRPYVLAMIGCAGISMTSVPVERASRPHGQSAYSKRMRLREGFMALTTTLFLKWQLLKSKNTIVSNENTSAD